MTADVAANPGQDRSGAALAFIHRLLCRPEADQQALDVLLGQLAEAFAVRTAALLVPVSPGLSFHGGQEPTWTPELDTLQSLRSSRLADSFPRSSQGSVLAAVIRLPDQTDLLLWLEDEQRTGWTTGEAVALLLAGQALERWLGSGERSARWVEQSERRARQQRLETVAQMARRLAHDYGNVFTGILGFTELSLSHPSPGHALTQSYLNEIFRSAQNGARLTQQLRLFSRREQAVSYSCSLAEVVEEEVVRIHALPEHTGKVHGSLLADLPLLAIDKEHLRHVVSAVLQNAVEASPPAGAVIVSADPVHLEPDQCADYYGDLKPGRHVVLTVADSGPGLTAEGWQRVLVEPLYTTKPRHRGLGLAVAYGILHAHRGGLRLTPRPEGGLLAEVLLPLSPLADLTSTIQTTAGVPTSSERVLVVDDDPAVLSYVQTTLEQAGYEVEAVSSAEAALHSYTSALPQRFQLVLSDVVMPRVNGVDLARQLLQKDAQVQLLFMSGQLSNEFVHHDLGHRFGLLAKPFGPDGLLRAVRSAIDRSGSWSSTALAPAS